MEAPTQDDNQPAAETTFGDGVLERYARTLNLDSAAAVLMSWTDKQRAVAKNGALKAVGDNHRVEVPERDFAQIPPAHQKMFRLLAVQVFEAASLPE